MEIVVVPPSGLHILTLYDPFVFASPDEEFFAGFHEYGAAIESEMFSRFWHSKAVRAILTTDGSRVPIELLQRNATPDCRPEVPLWELRPDADADAGLETALLRAAQSEYLSTYFLVDRASPALIESLAVWRVASQAPVGSVWTSHYNLAQPQMTPARWNEIRAILQKVRPEDALVGFGNEGTMLLVIAGTSLEDMAGAVEASRRASGL